MPQPYTLCVVHVILLTLFGMNGTSDVLFTHGTCLNSPRTTRQSAHPGPTLRRVLAKHRLFLANRFRGKFSGENRRILNAFSVGRWS